MSKILELREKRAKAWEAAKAFLDSKRGTDGMITTEDATTYDKMEADVVALGKEVERLERQAVIDLELSKATSSPITNKPEKNVSGETKTGRASDEYKRSFWNAMRSKAARPDVLDALQIGTDSEGGYLVPDEFEKTLVQALEEENLIRQLATVVSSSFGDKKIPIVASKGTADWTDEEAPMHESDDAFGIVNLGAHKLSTMIKVSEELLNDSVFSLETYIAQEFARRIGRAEEQAFISGNGTGKPTGLFTSAEVGITSAGAAIAMDDIIDLYHALREPYRRNAVFLTNDATIKAIRKLKDNNNQYLWQPSIQAGQPDTILNRPVRTSGYVPTIEASAKVLAFGDFKYYWIADRQGRSFQRLNELYAATGQVGFRATQRVDGKLILPEAVKLLQMKA